MAAVDLKGVVKSYDGKTNVIHGIDLDIKHGEFVVFVGPSGCGKSTLLRMIAGLETISGGTIKIGDQVVNDLPPRARDGLRLRGTDETEIKRRVMDAAKLLRIDHMLDRRPGALSGGQRQRVAIGRAIVRQPKVFLFDEPLSNLDAQLRGEMRSEIKRLHQRLGATIIYVTHDQVEAMTMADRIAVLSAGRKMQYDTPDTIYNQPAALFVAGFTGAPAMNLVDCTLTDGHADLGGGTQIVVPAALAARAGATAKLKFGIRPENLTLSAQASDDISVPAEVSLLEPLGAETLATMKVGAAEVIARCPASFREAPGSRLSLHLNPRHMRLFDAASGAAL
jgi:multiple sugar transport system ATP-binding protein